MVSRMCHPGTHRAPHDLGVLFSTGEVAGACNEHGGSKVCLYAFLHLNTSFQSGSSKDGSVEKGAFRAQLSVLSLGLSLKLTCGHPVCGAQDRACSTITILLVRVLPGNPPLPAVNNGEVASANRAGRAALSHTRAAPYVS
jgi:hypothetical protein